MERYLRERNKQKQYYFQLEIMNIVENKGRQVTQDSVSLELTYERVRITVGYMDWMYEERQWMRRQSYLMMRRGDFEHDSLSLLHAPASGREGRERVE